MPPKKKIKLLKDQNVVPDEDTDSDSAAQKGRKKAVATSPPLATTAQHEHLDGAAEVPQQIMGFVSQQELAKYARGLHIKRVMLADLKEQSDLDRGYVGGQVMGHYSKSYSQGHDLTVFIQDESTTLGSQHKHLMVTITDRLASEMPTLRDDAKLFLYNAVVKEDSCDFSQDHGKCLLMDRADAQIWIVHRDVNKEDFFKTSTCGKKWWTKTKQSREKIKTMWSVESAAASGPSKEPPASPSKEPPATASPSKESPASTSKEPPASTSKEPPACTSKEPPASTSKEPPASTSKEPPVKAKRTKGRPTTGKIYLTRNAVSAGHDSRSENSTSGGHAAVPASEPGGRVTEPENESFTFPDNPDFPDSAFKGGDSESDDAAQSDSDSSTDDSSLSGDSDREWNQRQQQQQHGNTGRAYKYRKLQALKIGDKKVNVFGVVKYFKPPALTRGTDYYSMLTLLDESEPKVGVRCVMFNRNPEKLPQVKRVGDIICLHRVNVGSYNCQVQLQGVKFSSVIRFSGELSKKVSPCTGSASFTCTLVERQRVKELRLWARKQRREAMHCLRSVVPGEYFDLACQVVSVTISKVPRCTVLTVWDATPHTLHCKGVSMEKFHEEGYPIVMDETKLSEDSEGYQVHVVVYNKKSRRKANELSPGQFVHLKSLHSSVEDSGGMVEICMHEEDKVLSDSPPPRIEVLNRSDDLRTVLEERMKHSLEAVTFTCHQDQPMFTVAEVTSYAGPFPAKFRCKVKVQRVSSPSLEDMVIVCCNQCDHTEVVSPAKEMDLDGTARNSCTVCSGGSSSELPACQFCFKMVVSDRTGSVEVTVAHEAAVQLFNNLKPNNFYQYQEARYCLLEKLYSLTGGNAPFATGDDSSCGSGGRPWVEGCVMGVQHEGIVHYLLFDTELRQNCIAL